MCKFIFGKSKVMKELQQTVKTISSYDIPIFVEGETGTGKTLLAREIHNLSPRVRGPFVYLDGATISPSLVESELFGHEKGAFTGATEYRSGLFEVACGGTVFLDEIENLTIDMQTKLLRVLEEKRFRRVGGAKEIQTDFRLISASNVDIRGEIKKGTFREDLYYRLKGFKLYIPPLRTRKEDILEYAEFFLELSNKWNQCHKRFSKEVTSFMLDYNWPGNVRELKSAIEEAAIKATRDEIRIEHFSVEQQFDSLICYSQENHISLAELERRYIQFVLTSVNFNKTRAAKILGIGPNTLYRKINNYGIDRAGHGFTA